jgi:DNA-directed RNA polymerase specialized sigma subunit
VEALANPLDWVLEKTGAKKKAPVLLPAPKMSKKDFTGQRSNEVQLWHDWKESGFHPKKLLPLYKSMENIIHKSASRYRNRVEIPTSAIDFEYQNIFTQAAKEWDPSKSQLHTWLTGQLDKRIQRFIKTNQNFTRMPEYRAAKVKKFLAVKAELTDQLGHEPPAQHIAEHTGFSLKEVKRLTKELRKGLVASGDADDIPQISPINMNARAEEVKHLIYPSLNKEEQIVHEYTFGMFGKPVLRTGELAKKMGWDDSKVSKLKKSIRTKMEKHMEVV